MKSKIAIIGGQPSNFTTPIVKKINDQFDFILIESGDSDKRHHESDAFYVCQSKLDDLSLENVDKVTLFVFALRSILSRLFYDLILRRGRTIIDALRMSIKKIAFQKKVQASFQDVNILNIHYVSPFLAPYVELFTVSSQKIILSFWGSDLFQATKSDVRKLQWLVDSSDCITMHSQEMKQKFVSLYGAKNADKVRLVLFGVPDSKFQLIDKLEERFSRDNFCRNYGIDNRKYIITVGHSGSEVDGHVDIIDSLYALGPSILQKCHFVFPMTYGGSKEYRQEVFNKIHSLPATTTILKTFLPTEEVVQFKLAEDILIHVLKSDALSAWMCESLYAGSHLVTGDWLPYSILRNQKLPITWVKTRDSNSIKIGIQEALRELLNSANNKTSKKFMSENIATSSQVNKWAAIYNDCMAS